MAKAEHKTKALLYKEARFLQNSGVLQQALIDALARRKCAVDRKRHIGDDTTFQVINHTRSQKMLYGQFLMYSKGSHPFLVAYEDGAFEFELEEHKLPEKDDGKRREFLESIFYFAISGNHVVLAQSSALRARDFETYLNWLLHETHTLDQDNHLALSDHASSINREKIEKAHVKKVQLGSPLETKLATELSPKQQGRNAQAVRYVPTGRGFDVLRAALGDHWFDQVRLKDALDDSNLQVKLEVTYIRKTPEHAQQILDEIALSMRHAEADDVTIKLHGGGEIRGHDLKINGPTSVRAYNGMLDQDELYARMREWLEQKIAQGLIDG